MARRERASAPAMRARATSAELDGAASASPAPASALRAAAADAGATGAPPGTTDVGISACTLCLEAPQPIRGRWERPGEYLGLAAPAP